MVSCTDKANPVNTTDNNNVVADNGGGNNDQGDNNGGNDNDSEPAAIDFNNIDLQDPYYKNSRGTTYKTDNGRNNSSATGHIAETPWEYELWYTDGNNSITLYSNGNFKTTWSGTSSLLSRVGYKYANSSDYVDYNTKNYIADYQFTKAGAAVFGCIGVYGWTYNPIVEYYIIEDWYGDKPSASALGTKKGELTVDGENYFIYENSRPRMSTPWGTQDIKQIFSVRQSASHQGRIHINAHFNRWNTMGLRPGKLVEVAMAVQVEGNATGSVDFTYFNLMALKSE